MPKRLSDEQVLAEARRIRAEERARIEEREAEERQREEQASRDQIADEAKRLRAAGWELVQELDGKPLWLNPPSGHTAWHNDALAALAAAERELAEARRLVEGDTAA